MTKVKIDETLCIGCGTCEALCPNVFKMDMDAGKSKVVAEECGNCNCQEAIDSCPVSAISKVDDGE